MAHRGQDSIRLNWENIYKTDDNRSHESKLVKTMHLYPAIMQEGSLVQMDACSVVVPV